MIFLIKKKIKRILAQTKALSRESVSQFGLRILLYHSIGGQPQDHPLAIRVPVINFEEQLGALSNSSYKNITLSEFIEAPILFNIDKYVVITFDDGYRDNITVACEILKKHNFRATFFICTSYIDGRSHKRWNNSQLREYMTWEDILSLSRMGFEIGSHMVNHIDLTSLSDKELFFQLSESKNILSERIKQPVKIFSCPYGRVDKRVIDVAKESGYIGGCASFAGWNFYYSDKYMLRRTEIDGYDTLRDFRSKIRGCYD